MADPVITDEAKYDRDLSRYQKEEIAREREEAREEQERAENEELDTLSEFIKDRIKVWPCQKLMDELLRKPTPKRVALFNDLLIVIEKTAGVLAKEKLDAGG